MKRYFVVHLSPEQGRGGGLAFEVQVLDRCGRSIFNAYFDGTEEETVADGKYVIPAAVNQAATRQKLGMGDYVNAEGQSIPPF